MLQVVGRIVGGADQFDVRFFNDVPNGHGRILKHPVAVLPGFFGGLLGERLVEVEVTAELQMTPVIQGVSDGASQNRGPGNKFVVIGSIARDQTLVDTARTHKAPFVVVAAEPELGDVVKFAILLDVLRADVTVIVNDRDLCGIVIEQNLCGLIGK